MTASAARGTFALDTINPSWPGVRIVAMEQPLRSGLARLRTMLDGAAAAVIAVRTQFDYDGVYETIEAIEPISAGCDAAARSEAMLAAYLSEISARNPSLQLESKTAIPLNILPATGSVVPGTFPPQHGGFKLANRALYESIYLRLHIIEQPADAGSIFDTILGYEGIQDSMIDYIARLGGYD